jgi:hypothetical protein
MKPELKDSLMRLRRYVEKEGFAGYDPYDALNSPILRRATLGLKWPRIAALQALKRSPVNLRPLLGVKKEYNPKALGLFLWSYGKLYRADPRPEYLARVEFFLDRLSESRSPGIQGHGWGYNFDWQSRAMFVPRHTPTVVNSAFVGHALLDVHEWTGSSRCLEMALPIADFILTELNRIADAGDFCFSYTPVDRYAVHNANLLGASILIRLARLAGREDARDAALSSLSYSMRHQHADGAWWYAERESSHWIDSFHTGFVLQAIRVFLDLQEGVEHSSAYQRGVQYYARQFFDESGRPSYYHDQVYPIDVHAPSQALVFFSREDGYYDLAERVGLWMCRNLQDDAGYFYFQLTPRYLNRVPYMRWSQAWAMHGLTHLLSTGEGG